MPTTVQSYTGKDSETIKGKHKGSNPSHSSGLPKNTSFAKHKGSGLSSYNEAIKGKGKQG